jgi:hypothetical protein
MVRLSIGLVFLLCTNCFADETPDILLPTNSVVVEPKPVPIVETNATELPASTWYVIQSKTALTVIDSRQGYISLKEHKLSSSTSATYIGKFVGGSGSFDEERTYPINDDYNFIYVVRALKKGTVELILLPKGADDTTGIQRQILTVMGGSPNPPPILDVVPDVTPDIGPDVIPDVIPDVTPKPDPKPTGLRVLVVHDNDATKEQQNTIYSLELMYWLSANCTQVNGISEWRKFDRSTIETTGLARESQTWQKLWDKCKPLLTSNNMIFIATDTKTHYMKIGNTKDTIQFLQQVKDGKL